MQYMQLKERLGIALIVIYGRDYDFESGKPSKQGLRQKKVAFSDSEDNFIRNGISKYGYGRWTSILNDPSFKFHPSRKPCTLAVRAKKI